MKYYVTFFFIMLMSHALSQEKKTIYIDRIAVDIINPKGKRLGDILVLPGWNISRDQWCSQTSLCEKASQAGYRLIMPEMGKSIYASQYYPESRKDWISFPTREWMSSKLIPELQKKYELLLMGNNNFLLGLSTGGRGAIALAMDLPQLFLASASLSGDFDQTLDQHDKLMVGIYGSYQKFPERWTGKDNLAKNAWLLKVPLYLGHGALDKIVPVIQSRSFHDALKKINNKFNLIYHEDPRGAHDFKYWDSETVNVFSFFSSHIKKAK